MYYFCVFRHIFCYFAFSKKYSRPKQKRLIPHNLKFECQGMIKKYNLTIHDLCSEGQSRFTTSHNNTFVWIPLGKRFEIDSAKFLLDAIQYLPIFFPLYPNISGRNHVTYLGHNAMIYYYESALYAIMGQVNNLFFNVSEIVIYNFRRGWHCPFCPCPNCLNCKEGTCPSFIGTK